MIPLTTRTHTPLSIAIVGAGMGGLTAASTLRLFGFDEQGSRVTLAFDDGSRAEADLVIGADGVHSIVRDMIIGPDAPIHKGRIAYRAVFPSSLMGGRDIGNSRTKWWGLDRHIV